MQCSERQVYVKPHTKKMNGKNVHVDGYCKKLHIGQRTEEEKRMLQRRSYKKGEYKASVFHPLAFEDQVYAVSISRKPKTRDYYLDRDRFFTQEEASSSREAYKKVLNSRDFKYWKEKNRGRTD